MTTDALWAEAQRLCFRIGRDNNEGGQGLWIELQLITLRSVLHELHERECQLQFANPDPLAF